MSETPRINPAAEKLRDSANLTFQEATVLYITQFEIAGEEEAYIAMAAADANAAMDIFAKSIGADEAAKVKAIQDLHEADLNAFAEGLENGDYSGLAI